MSAVVGAVIAGGRSVRYGAPKALAEVAGARIVDRVLAALGEAVRESVLIANDPALAAEVALPARADAIEGLGALGGIHAALQWAAERGAPGILAVACDMPFLSAALLSRLLERAAAEDPPDVVLPASRGPRGIEPLCAYYGVGCIAAIERAVGRDDRRVIGFHGDVRVEILPVAEVETFGDPDVLFLNVNTREDRAAAERIAAAGADR